jgi:hypothetical protein
VQRDNHRSVSGFTLAIALTAQMGLQGCRRDRFRAEVRHDFSGQVDIACSQSGSVQNSPSVMIDRLITLDLEWPVAGVCPKDEPELVVLRDGRTVEVNGRVNWNRTLPVVRQGTLDTQTT